MRLEHVIGEFLGHREAGFADRVRGRLEIVDRARQEVRKVGFWKNASMRELLTRQFVRDLDGSGVCPPGKARDIAQRLVALAKENHESLAQG